MKRWAPKIGRSARLSELLRSVASSDRLGLACVMTEPDSFDFVQKPAASGRGLLIRLSVASLVAISIAISASAQSPSANPNETPAFGNDPAHRHKAYAKTTYGISCPGDRVVWVNTKSGVYHLEGERWFGRTSEGAYECEKGAIAEGDRETRNGQ